MTASAWPRPPPSTELAAALMANRDIAERLGLSPRTIENHLHRAFTKGGVDRRDLGAVLPG